MVNDDEHFEQFASKIDELSDKIATVCDGENAPIVIGACLQVLGSALSYANEDGIRLMLAENFQSFAEQLVRGTALGQDADDSKGETLQ